MTVRPAKAADVMRIIALAEEAKNKSIYAERGNIDRDAAKKMFARGVHMHGHSHDGATLFLVSEAEGVVEGYALFGLGRAYQIADVLCAGDVHVNCSERAPKSDAADMLEQFIAWAEQVPGVIEITVTDSAFLGQASRGLSKFLTRNGFEPSITTYRRSIERV